jgi:hypothetical protein
MPSPSLFKFLNWITNLPVALEDALVSALTLPLPSNLNTTMTALFASYSPVLRGNLGGFNTSNDGTSPLTVLDISTGQCTSDDFTTSFALTSAFTKSTGGTWVAGSGSNGLDAGSVAASTWYHVYAIFNPTSATTDIIFSTNASSPAFPSGYTLSRRIWSFLTDGAKNILPYTQFGNVCVWKTVINDVATVALGTGATLFTVSVPLGIKCTYMTRGTSFSGTVSVDTLISSPDEASSAVNNVVANRTTQIQVASAALAVGHMIVRTNTSSQIRAVADTASTSLTLSTFGYEDLRGQYS